MKPTRIRGPQGRKLFSIVSFVRSALLFGGLVVDSFLNSPGQAIKRTRVPRVFTKASEQPGSSLADTNHRAYLTIATIQRYLVSQVELDANPRLNVVSIGMADILEDNSEALIATRPSPIAHLNGPTERNGHRLVRYGETIVGGSARVVFGDVNHYHITKSNGGGADPSLQDLDKEQELKILAWLSESNFWDKHSSVLNRAQPGTGQAIFEEVAFKSWLADTGRVLWCVGEAGTGKTITASLIIEHILSKKKSTEALVWIYADYREHGLQDFDTLMKNVLAQLYQQSGKVSAALVQTLGTNWKRAKLSPSDYRSWIGTEIKKYSKTMVVVDAIDELRDQTLAQEFLQELQRLGPTVALLVTARNSPGDLISGDVIELEVRPKIEDVKLYVEARLEEGSILRDRVKVLPEIKNLIFEKLKQAKDKMFLKATLLLNIIEHTKPDADLRKTIHSLPPGYHGYYDFSLKQIERQDDNFCQLALRVLAILTHSLVLQGVEALRHALSATQRGSTTDCPQPPSLKKIIDACQGLVVLQAVEGLDAAGTNRKRITVGLYHETTSNFLKGYQSPDFPDGHKLLLESSLAYLSMPQFATRCHHQSQIEERAQEHHFYSYAASQWMEHAKVKNLEVKYRTQIVDYLESRCRLSADEFMGTRRPSAWGCSIETPWTDWNRKSHDRVDLPLHAAAFGGLEHIARFLLDEKNYNKDVRNNFGETPLHRAAQSGQQKVMDLLLSRGASIDATVKQWYLGNADSLILSTICHKLDAVLLCLNRGMDVNRFDVRTGYAPLHLAASMWTDMTQLLLDFGADPNVVAKSPFNPEIYPMTPLHFVVFNAHTFEKGVVERLELLLDRGAAINAQSGTGNTPLHIALLGGHLELAILLLRRDARYDIVNMQGKTAYQIAREKGQFAMRLHELPDQFSRKLKPTSQLLYSAWSQDDLETKKLLGAGAKLEERDENGSNIWVYCIGSCNKKLAEILLEHMKDRSAQETAQIDALGHEAFIIALNSMTKFDYTDQTTWHESLAICKALLPFYSKIDPDLEFIRSRSPIGRYNKTYLIHAAEQQRIEQVKFLLDIGADVDAQDIFGETGLHYAISRNAMATVELLVQYGCSFEVQNRKGRAAIDVANDTSFLDLKRYLYAKLEERCKCGSRKDHSVGRSKPYFCKADS